MKTTKQVALLAVIMFFSSAAVPLPSLDMANMRVDIKSMLTNGPHQPAVTTPHVGGSPPPCPSGGNCG